MAETEEPAGFFEPGKTYEERHDAYRAPELVKRFQCVAVAPVPSGAVNTAFGFMWHVFPGDDWRPGAFGPGGWKLGWDEVGDGAP